MKDYSNNNRIIKCYQSRKMDLDFDKELQIQYEKKGPLMIHSYKNAKIFPLKKSIIDNSAPLIGGIHDVEGTFINHALTKRLSPRNIKMSFDDWFEPSKDSKQSKTKKVDKKVVFLGALPKHYGHFITEGISRAWYHLKSENKDQNYVYISEDGPDNFLEFFEFLGINLSQIKKIDEASEFSEIVIPEPSIRLHDYYHKNYNDTISNILKAIPKSNENKIYLSKKQRFNGRAIGERTIERLFKREGFEIIYPENIPLKKFLSIVKSAKTLVSSSGSSAHNAVFMEKSAQFICLNRSRHHHPLQIMIDEMRTLNVFYIETCQNIFQSDFSKGPYNLFITKYLLNFFKDNKFKSPKIMDFITIILSTILYFAYVVFLGKLINLTRSIKNSIKNFST